MIGFLSFLLLGALVYFVWRIVDQLPDIVFRLGEIQRDIAELRRHQERPSSPVSSTPASNPPGSSSPASISPGSGAPPAPPQAPDAGA